MARIFNRIHPIVLLPFLLAVPIILYGLFWFYAAHSAQGGLNDWAEARRAEGFEVDLGNPKVGGFPLRITVALTNPSIIAPESKGGWRWRTGAVKAVMSPIDFGRVKIAAPGRHTIKLPAAQGGGDATVTAGEANLEAALGLDGRLVDGLLTLAQAQITGLTPTGVVKVGDFSLHTGEGDGTTEVSRAVILDVGSVTLPPQIAPALGGKITALKLRAGVLGAIPDGPLAKALGSWREAGGTVKMSALDIDWPPLRVRGSGTFALDNDLQPTGRMSAELEGFFQSVDKLTAAGLIRQRDSSMAKVVLGLMAKTPPNGGPPTISIPLTLQGRKLYAGPVPLLEMERMTWGGEPARSQAPIGAVEPRPLNLLPDTPPEPLPLPE